MASTRLKNPATGASVPAERKTLTWSGWIKKSKVGADQDIYTGRYSGSYFAHLAFDSDDKIRIRQYAGGSSPFFLKTTAVFRDPNAWYHIVMAVDTTQGTNSNRIKLYVNGEQITAFDTETYPSQDLATYWQMTGTDSYPSYLGWDGTYYFDGIMADVYIIGGTAYAASTFGETDSTTGEWKPNTSPTISYGTGVAGNAHLKFDDTSNFGKNSAPGFTSNHWSVDNGTMTNTKDCPSNNFCTLSGLYNIDGSYSLENGNTKFVPTGNNDGTFGTLAGIGGKFYYEVKFAAGSNTIYAGYSPVQLANNEGNTNPITSFIGQYRNTGLLQIGGSTDTAYTNVSDGDIFAFAIDLEASSGSRTVKAYKNGSLYGTVTIGTSYENDMWLPVAGDTSGGNAGRLEFNFGNGYFGTTAVSSAGTNASNIGIFEYDVPSGYTALSTKGLNL